MTYFAYYGPAETREEALHNLLQHHDYVGVDTETIALKGEKKVFDEDEGFVTMDARTPIGIGIATSTSEAFYFPLGRSHAWKHVPALDDISLNALREKLSRRDETKVGFNFIFDLDRIETALDIEAYPFHDPSIALQVQGLPNSLEDAAGQLMGINHMGIQELLAKYKTGRQTPNMLDIPYEETAWKNLMDTVDTLRLFELMKMREWKRGESVVWHDLFGREYVASDKIIDCYEVDRRMVMLLRKMAKRKVRIREDFVAKRYTDLSRQLVRLDLDFDQYGFNPGSPKQVGRILAERGHWLPASKSGKQLATSEDILLGIIGEPLIEKILLRRKVSKLKSTYYEPLRDKDKVSTIWRLDLASGRLASSGPDIPLLTFPPADREVFDPEYGVYSWMDFSQIEMRLFAYKSQDPVMLQVYRDYDAGLGDGIHQSTLEAINPGKTKKSDPVEYLAAKTYNFAMIFDATANTLSKQTRTPIERTTEVRKRWITKYARGYEWMQERKADPLPYVETDFGRRCRLPDAIYVREDHIEKCKINYYTQGTGADVLKRAALKCDRWGFEFPILLHDEILCDGDVEFPDALAEIHPAIRIPFEVHHGRAWE